MNNSGIAVLSFIGGAAIGAIIAWKVTDKVVSKKYSDIAQEEIDSVKAKFTVPKVEVKKEETEKKEDPLVKAVTSKPSLSDYAKKIKEYTNYSNVEEEKAHFEPKNKTKPYVISPDEFGDDEEYDQQELTFYSDGILADEDDTILNIDEVVGKDAIKHIGDYEDDAVHVKNEARKVYYEILVDERSYLDVTGKTADDDYNLYRHLGEDKEDK